MRQTKMNNGYGPKSVNDMKETIAKRKLSPIFFY